MKNASDIEKSFKFDNTVEIINYEHFSIRYRTIAELCSCIAA